MIGSVGDILLTVIGLVAILATTASIHSLPDVWVVGATGSRGGKVMRFLAAPLCCLPAASARICHIVFGS